MKLTLQSSNIKFGSTALFLLSFIVLFFLACSPESFDPPETTFDKIEIKYLTKDELKTHQEEYRRLTEVKNRLTIKAASSASRMVYDSVYDFHVDIDRVLYITANNFRFYTFAIYREGSKETENLVLRFNPRGELTATIVKYDFTDEEIRRILNGESVSTRNKTEAEIIIREEREPCFERQVIVTLTLDGDEFYDYETVEVDCPPETGNGPGGGGNPGGYFGGGGNNGGPNAPPPRNLTLSDNMILTSPAIPIPILQENAHTQNCDKLKAMSNNAPMKSALNNLKTKLNDTKEHGYKLEKGSTGNTCEALPPGNGNSIEIPTGGKKYGAFHSHPNGLKPMFSAQDIEVLYRLMKNFDYTGENVAKMVSQFVYTVTTVDGTYALKSIVAFFSVTWRGFLLTLIGKKSLSMI